MSGTLRISRVSWASGSNRSMLEPAARNGMLFDAAVPVRQQRALGLVLPPLARLLGAQR